MKLFRRVAKPADSPADIAKGTTRARDIREQLAIEEAMANPSAGLQLGVVMNDPRWPASAGWVKMQQKVGDGQTIVHYNLNTATGAVADFKIVMPGAR